MRKIAVALTKGGVGKTTTAVSLAAGLAMAGKRVLLVDVDTQNQSAISLGLRHETGLAELAAGETSPEEALAAARPNLWVLGGGKSLAGLKRLIARKDFGGEQTLAEVMAEFEGRYDFVVLDTAPGWDALSVNTLFYANEVLTPVSLEVMTLQGLLEFARSLDSIRHYRPDLSIRTIVPTFFDRRVKKSEEILAQLQGHFGDLVCAPIRYNVRLSEAPGYGQTIFEYAPRSAGAEDYQQLVQRILQDE